MVRRLQYNVRIRFRRHERLQLLKIKLVINKIRNIKDLPVIGWREWAKLPDLGINRIKVKVDTGARTSSLHVLDLENFTKDGKPWVRFKVHPIQRTTKKTVRSEAPVLEFRSVRNSGGKATMRPVIITSIKLLGDTWPVELTLANRDEMGFRMLLGREAIRQRFLVDSGGSYYNGKPKRKKKKAAVPSDPTSQIAKSKKIQPSSTKPKITRRNDS